MIQCQTCGNKYAQGIKYCLGCGNAIEHQGKILSHRTQTPEETMQSLNLAVMRMEGRAISQKQMDRYVELYTELKPRWDKHKEDRSFRIFLGFGISFIIGIIGAFDGEMWGAWVIGMGFIASIIWAEFVEDPYNGDKNKYKPITPALYNSTAGTKVLTLKDPRKWYVVDEQEFNNSTISNT